ncbi:hypothetical protein LZK76_37050 (plasmid) [Rhizobium leguminosarum]|nr:hypothetical protein LZK76_37050 [Rhizobium leguminosarum]
MGQPVNWQRRGDRAGPAGYKQSNGCRDFVTSKQSLEGVTRFNGVACPSDGSWKINGSSGLH